MNANEIEQQFYTEALPQLAQPENRELLRRLIDEIEQEAAAIRDRERLTSSEGQSN